MSNFSISPNDWRFPVTIVAICLPFFFSILVLQTNTGMKLLRGFVDYVIRQPVKGLARRLGRIETTRAVTSHHSTVAATSSEGKHEAVSPGKRDAKSHSHQSRPKGGKRRMADVEEGELIY